MVKCSEARNEARDFVHDRWAVILTPRIFKKICKHVNNYEESNNPDDKALAISEIKKYGYNDEQAEELLYYGFPTIIARSPGIKW